MEQKDIDRLLTCRKAIDDHRARKLVAREVEASATTANKASTYLTMQTAFTNSKDTYLAVLLENGFESYEAFSKFNEDMCIALLMEYRTAYNNCDFCKDYKSTAPCSEDFDTNSCFITSKIITIESMYADLLNMYRAGNTITDTKDQVLRLAFGNKFREVTLKDGNLTRCPNFQNYYDCKVPDSEFPFSLVWK